jgi:hypothetical protein
MHAHRCLTTHASAATGDKSVMRSRTAHSHSTPPLSRALLAVRWLCELGRVAVVASRCLRQFRTYLEDDLFANLHSPRFRARRFGDVSSPCARDGHEPSCPRLAMIRGYCRGALQRRAVGIVSGACPKEDVTAWHPPDVEPPIVGPGDVEAESVVVSICTPGQDLPPARQGILDQSGVIVWVSGVCSNHVLKPSPLHAATHWPRKGQFLRRRQTV